MRVGIRAAWSACILAAFTAPAMADHIVRGTVRDAQHERATRGGDGAPPGGLEFPRPRSRPADGPERYAAEAEYKDIIGAIAA